MSDLIQVRRGIVAAQMMQTPQEDWDAVWKYTDGLPTNFGWTLTATDTPTMASSGLQLKRARYDKAVEITHGSIEGRFKIGTRSNVAGVRAMLRIGNGTNSINVVFVRTTYGATLSDRRIVLYDATSQIQNGTLIGNFDFGTEYVLRIDINGGTGSVSLNGTTIADNVDTTTMAYPGALRFGNNQQYAECTWKYVKYKNLEI